LKHLCLIVITVWPFLGYAKPNMTTTAGIGFTTNANLEDANPKNDFILQLRARGTIPKNSDSFRYSLGYSDYIAQSMNDHLNWRAEYEKPTKLKIKNFFRWVMGLWGQNYLQGSPATSEENFDWVGARTYLFTETEINAKLNWYFEAGYSFRRFSYFANRLDHQISFLNEVGINLNADHNITPWLELAFVTSSDPIYSKSVFSIGTLWRWKTAANFRTEFDLVVKNSTFPNRSVSTSTDIAVKRGRYRSSTLDDREVHNFLQIGATAIKSVGLLEYGATLMLTQQGSRSGFENYNEEFLLAFANYQF
jgi:hypothetical protein